MKTVVISQPMFFPWVGLLEQVRLADVYVHYDDVQFSKGHFANRVQVKAAGGFRWLTVPLRDLHLGQKINEVHPDDRKDWRGQHVELLGQHYRDAPYREDMLGLARDVYKQPAASLAAVSMASMHALIDYFELAPSTEFHVSSRLGLEGQSSRRVLDIVKHLGGDRYVTGHGARNYLNHELFEAEGVRVEYIDYQKKPYPQLHGEFNPFVSALDLAANVGRGGRDVFSSGTVYWRDFLAGTQAEPPMAKP
jgi:hypothetical protein